MRLPISATMDRATGETTFTYAEFSPEQLMSFAPEVSIYMRIPVEFAEYLIKVFLSLEGEAPCEEGISAIT